ncbi:MAG: flagellar basal body P-ring formation protein FlgA [Rickettsiaceae bacterium H1]|nr:flagellar basal body P-ring formation protein FlgA [Rickettsiaceae bacterium H1]
MFINKLAIYKLSFFLLFAIKLTAENIPVTNKFIKKGTIIPEQDITYIEIMKRNNQDILTESSMLTGSLAIQDIKPRSPILKNQIKQQNIILRNNIVDISYYNNGITLKTKGIALQNGKYDNIIKIKSMNNNKQIIGTVKGRNKIVVKP